MWGEARGHKHQVVQTHHILPYVIWKCGDFKSNLEINVLACGKSASTEWIRGSLGTQKVSDKVCSRPKLQIKYLRMSSKRKWGRGGGSQIVGKNTAES